MANGGDFLLGLLGGATEGGKGAVDFLTQQRQFQAEQQFRQQQLVQQAALAREEMALVREKNLYEREEGRRTLLQSTIDKYVSSFKGKNVEAAIERLRKDPELAGLNAIYPNFQEDVEAGIKHWFTMQAPKAEKAKIPVPAGLTPGEARVARGTQALGGILPTVRPTPQVGAQAAQFPFSIPGLAGGLTEPAARVGREVGRGVQAGVTGRTPPEPQFQMPKGLENMAVNVKGNMSDIVNTLMQLIGQKSPIPRR